MDLTAKVTLVKDIVAALTAIIAAYVAIAGLGAWRKQLAGKTEYEAARRLLKAVYTLREAINLVRNPFMSGGEIESAMKNASIESPPKRSLPPPAATTAAYEERWKWVSDAMSSLNAEAYEAEVLWRDKTQSALNPLRACVAQLQSDLSFCLGPPRDLDRSSFPKEEWQRINKTVFGLYGSNTNEFSTELRTAVEVVEQYLRPHLSTRPRKAQTSALHSLWTRLRSFFHRSRTPREK